MKNYLNQLFTTLTDNLELTKSQEGSIEHAYNVVADWLNKKETLISKYDIEIYPQGSMKLGTVVKPLKTDDYDVDMVCVLKEKSGKLSPREVKKLVGDRLKESDFYKTLLDKEGKRCWTLIYSDNLNFHMDILPAIPIDSNTINATRVVKGNYEWLKTSPHKYAEWFKNCMNNNVSLTERGDIEQIPEYPRKTVLQKTIQLMKRHRDVMFIDDQDNAPASIIITTLAAQIYNNENDIYGFLGECVARLDENINIKNGVYYVTNPVDESENFADRWKEKPSRKDAFYIWLNKLREDYLSLCYAKTSLELKNILYDMFGQQAVDKSEKSFRYGKIVPNILNEANKNTLIKMARELSMEHREDLYYNVPKMSLVKIKAQISNHNYAEFIDSGDLIDKEMKISFTAIHNESMPYKILWQITNTGKEARLNNCFRGGFDRSIDTSPNTRVEHSDFSGLHFVQCFVIKNNHCVAKSKEFIVNIK